MYWYPLVWAVMLFTKVNSKVFGNYINECIASPCENDGTCINSPGSFTCVCKNGYSGDRCQDVFGQVRTDCSVNPCEHRSLCIDTFNGYECKCAGGYTGVNCETELDECASLPCQHGSTCHDQVNAYACMCQNGYTGVNCETNINDCVSNPCQNNGTCIDKVADYSCACLYGYSGTHCETRIDVDDCANNPCMNNGTCIDGRFIYTCVCSSYYKGTNCETACHYAKADIVMLLDSSGSVSYSNFQKLKAFTSSLARRFTISNTDVQMSVVTFSTGVHKQFDLNENQDLSSLIISIGNTAYHSGTSHTDTAIDYLIKHSFTTAAGDRPDAPNIAIILTDGQSNDKVSTAREITLLHQLGVTTVAIGIGRAVDLSELNILASNGQLVFNVSSFDALPAITGLLDHKICQASGNQLNANTYPTPVAIIPARCADKLRNCYAYGVHSCNTYKQWASDNCPKYCNFCTDLAAVSSVSPFIIG